MPRPRRILVIRSSALGDVAMTLPVVYSAARRYPDVEFHVLTRPFFARLFINRPPNVHLVEADFKGRYKGPAGMMRLLCRLRRCRFTDVADLHNVLRSWIIDTYMRLLGKRVRMVDKGRRRRGRAMGGGESQTPYVSRYADVFRRLGLPVELDFAGLYPDGAPAKVAVDHPAVGIAPFARYANKTYPPELMEQVVERLTAAGVNVYLYGARGDEAATLDGWAARHPRCVSLAGKMPLEDELAAMAAMDLMLTMDSANQHLASLAGTRVVGIWGSTTPACGFLAYGQSPDDALTAGLPCQPCTVAGSADCPLGDLRCMHALTPEAVARKVIDRLPKK